MQVKLQGFAADVHEEPPRAGMALDWSTGSDTDQPAPEDLEKQGLHEAAVSACLQRLKENNTDIDLLLCLARNLKALNRWDDALRALDLVLVLEPEHLEARFQKGHVCELAGRMDAAVGHYLHVIKIDQENAAAFNNLGSVLYGMGQVKEASSAFHMVTELKPELDSAQSSFLATLNYRADLDPQAVVDEHLAWGRRTANTIRALAPGRMRPAEPGVLRLGILSGDLYEHPIAHFLIPLLEHLDRNRFKVYVYAWSPLQDSYTSRLRGLADGWQDVHELDPKALAMRMREDQVNIALELAGHTNSNRLQALAYRPAPVQVSWLGYPNTTGLPTMDFRVVDDVVAPAGSAAENGAEALLRLPNGFHCYAPPEGCPEVGPLPAESNGVVTFGCFNRNAKISPQTIECWKRILTAVPDSRLLLKSKWFLDPVVQELYLTRLTDASISSERVVFLPWEERSSDGLCVYHDVDIALDPFPYNGTTTTCEAVWMGVPVVTLSGGSQAARTGASLLRQLGVEAWAADSPETYVKRAVTLATDLEALKQLRSTLREHMRSSALMDGAAFARDFGEALFNAWNEKIGVHLADDAATEGASSAPEPPAPAVRKRTKGVLYVLWGEQGEPILERSRAALSAIHPELPVEVIRLPEGSNLLDKARVIRQTPFDQTLFLDIDTVVLDRLDFGFQMAERNGIACCICECPWARRYPSIRGDLVEYNTGVLFLSRRADPVLESWESLAGTMDSSIPLVIDGEKRVMPLNDQASFAQAVCAWDQTPFILPMNWNFRPQWHRSLFGPVKIWHDYRDVPPAVRQWSMQQKDPDAIIQYYELPAGMPC